MSALVFVNYPSDVLLEITNYLELGDVVTFLSVCSSFRKLSEQRYLWISVLERTQQHRRLACPIGVEISNLDTSTIRQIAHLTHRVEKNWNRKFPRVLRAVLSKTYTSSEVEPGAILAVIPGTSFVVLYTQENTQQVICCDLEGLGPPASVYVGNISRRAHYDGHGNHLMALAIGSQFDEEKSLRILSLTYGDNKKTTFEQIFQAPLDSPCRAIFICKDVVGVIPYADEESRLSIRATNFVTNVSVNISIEFGTPIHNSSYIFCSIVDSTPFIITAEDKSYEVRRLPPELLPYGSNGELEDSTSIDGNLIRIADIDVTEQEDSYDLETAELKWSPKGLHAIFVKYCRGYSECTKTLVCYWPLADSYPPLLCKDNAVVDMTLEGKVGSYIQSRVSPWLVALSPSGTYAAIILDRKDDRTSESDACIQLLQFSECPPAVECRELRCPSYIRLEEIYALSVDERCGLVYLSHSHGHIFALPYA